MGLLLVISNNGESAPRLYDDRLLYDRAIADLVCLTSPHSTNRIIEFSLEFANVYYGGIWQAAQTCSNDLPGVEDAGACCVAACGICGGSGCGDRARDAGLSGDDCCVAAIRDAGVYCDDSMAAPCLIGSGKCFNKAG